MEVLTVLARQVSCSSYVRIIPSGVCYSPLGGRPTTKPLVRWPNIDPERDLMVLRATLCRRENFLVNHYRFLCGPVRWWWLGTRTGSIVVPYGRVGHWREMTAWEGYLRRCSAGRIVVSGNQYFAFCPNGVTGQRLLVFRVMLCGPPHMPMSVSGPQIAAKNSGAQACRLYSMGPSQYSSGAVEEISLRQNCSSCVGPHVGQSYLHLIPVPKSAARLRQTPEARGFHRTSKDCFWCSSFPPFADRQSHWWWWRPFFANFDLICSSVRRRCLPMVWRRWTIREK